MKKQALDLSFINNIDPKLLYGALLGGGGALAGWLLGGKRHGGIGALIGALAGGAGGYFGGDWLQRQTGIGQFNFTQDEQNELGPALSLAANSGVNTDLSVLGNNKPETLNNFDQYRALAEMTPEDRNNYIGYFAGLTDKYDRLRGAPKHIPQSLGAYTANTYLTSANMDSDPFFEQYRDWKLQQSPEVQNYIAGKNQFSLNANAPASQLNSLSKIKLDDEPLFSAGINPYANQMTPDFSGIYPDTPENYKAMDFGRRMVLPENQLFGPPKARIKK